MVEICFPHPLCQGSYLSSQCKLKQLPGDEHLNVKGNWQKGRSSFPTPLINVGDYWAFEHRPKTSGSKPGSLPHTWCLWRRGIQLRPFHSTPSTHFFLYSTPWLECFTDMLGLMSSFSLIQAPSTGFTFRQRCSCVSWCSCFKNVRIFWLL